MPNVTVPGVFDAYATINLSYQTQQNANIAMSLLSQIYAAAAAGTLQVKNDGEATTGGAGPLKEFTIGDSGGIQNTGTTEGTVPAGYLGIVDAYTNQVSEIVGAPGQANETVVAGGNMHFFTNGGSGTVISGQGNNLVAANPAGEGDWTVIFDGGDNTVYATSGNFSIDDGNSGTTGNNLIFLGSGNDTVQSWGHDTIVAAPGGTALVATFTPGSTFWGNSGSSVFINLGGADTFFAGPGGHDSVFAAASGGVYFGNTGSLVFVSGFNTANTVSAGAGNTTIWGASGSDGLYFVGPGNFVMTGAAESQTVVGGSGSSAVQLFGIDGAKITLFSPINGNQLIAGPGNVTLNGAGSGNDVFFAGPSKGSADSIVAGSGNNTLVAGPGTSTLVGGAGANVFSFSKAVGGGSDSIVGWNSKDLVALSGYGAPTSPGGLPADTTAKLVGGSEVLTLSDGTKITLVDFPHIPHISSS